MMPVQKGFCSVAEGRRGEQGAAEQTVKACVIVTVALLAGVPQGVIDFPCSAICSCQLT